MKKSKAEFLSDLKNSKKFKLKSFVMMTLAGAISAAGVTVFLEPVKLYDSGITGTSMLLSQLTPDWFSLSLFLLLLNIPILLYGFKKQGLEFTVYAIYTVGVYSLCAWLIKDVLPIDVSTASPLAGNDVLLCALFGGVTVGVGSGIAIRYGGAVDGIEVIAIIFAKKLNLTVGSFCMIYSVILYIICGFFIHSWILPLYSIVTYFTAVKTIDFIVDGFDGAKGAFIITDNPRDICDALTYTFGCGLTKVEARGGYSDNEKTMIYFVVNRFQVTKMKEIVHSIDPKAYITINDVADVYSLAQSEQK